MFEIRRNKAGNQASRVNNGLKGLNVWNGLVLLYTMLLGITFMASAGIPIQKYFIW
jgi:hypothetical protein